MGWRTLLVRTPVVVALVGIALGAVLYQWWTNPRAVRQLLLDKLGDKFPAASVRVESAQLRLLGGISFAELRLARRDGLDAADFLYVPSGVIFHDKERLLDGLVGVRKLELDKPRLRLVRERDGTFNLAALAGPGRPDERLPTVVLRQATVEFEDRTAAPGTPLLELRQLDVTVVNDPIDTIRIEGRGTTDVLGPVRVQATANRTAGTLDLTVTLDAIPLGAELAKRVGRVAPAAADHLRGVRGQAAVEAGLHVDPKAATPVGFDVRVKVERGEVTHPALPLTLEKVNLTFTASNRVTPESLWPRSPLGVYLPAVHLDARAGATKVHLDAVGVAVPDKLGPIDGHDLYASIEGAVENLDLTEKVMAAMPDSVRDVEPNFQPRGPATITHVFRRLTDTAWTSHWHAAFHGARIRYHDWPYPVGDVRGTVDRVNTQAGRPVLKAELIGRVAGATMRLTGAMTGPTPSAVDFTIAGEGLTVEEALLAALPEKSRALARQFHPAGKFGLEVNVLRPAGAPHYRNRYRIRCRDMAFRYDLFPYALERVTGELDVTTEAGVARWEARQLRGFHQGAEVQVEARSVPAGGRLDQWPTAKLRTPAHPSVGLAPVRTVGAVQVRLHGTNVPVDADLEAAIAPEAVPARRPLQKAWQTMNPSGRLNFAAEVVDLPDLPNAIAVGVAVSGCRLQPRFFELPLDGLEGTVHFSQGRVDLLDVKASHAPGRISLPGAAVFLKPAGGFQARLDKLLVTDMPATAAFVQALPPPLRKIVEAIRLGGTFNATTKLVIETDEKDGPPTVWWEGGLGLRDGRVDLGVEVSGITGQFSSSGKHNGQKLDVAYGNVLLEQATILRQPLRQLRGTFEMTPDQPDRLQLRHFNGSLFGGTVAAEGHVRFAPAFGYKLRLTALQLDLEQFGRHNFPAAGAELQGQATADLHLVGDGVNLSDLRGNGRIDVPNGRIYRLPVMLDLLRTISLRVPDQTAFDKASVTFALEGPRMVVEDLKLSGYPVSLRGEGTANLDGSNVALDISGDWGKFLPPGLSVVPRWFGDQLFQIKVRGKIDQLRYEKELIPGMMAPLKQAIGGS